MAEKAFPLDNKLYDSSDLQLYTSTRTSGVYAADALTVSVGDGGMNVTLGTGIAWLHITDYGGVVYANTADLTLTVPDPDNLYDRIDRVVIRYDKSTQKVAAEILEGEPSSDPIAPGVLKTVSSYGISVAQIRVYKGVYSITASQINCDVDRLDPQVCGLMADSVSSIDTAAIKTQIDGLVSDMSTKVAAELASTQETCNEKMKEIQEDLEAAEQIEGGVAVMTDTKVNQLIAASVDTTLATSGAPADSAAVGTALKKYVKVSSWNSSTATLKLTYGS